MSFHCHILFGWKLKQLQKNVSPHLTIKTENPENQKKIDKDWAIILILISQHWVLDHVQQLQNIGFTWDKSPVPICFLPLRSVGNKVLQNKIHFVQQHKNSKKAQKALFNVILWVLCFQKVSKGNYTMRAGSSRCNRRSCNQLSFHWCKLFWTKWIT